MFLSQTLLLTYMTIKLIKVKKEYSTKENTHTHTHKQKKSKNKQTHNAKTRYKNKRSENTIVSNPRWWVENIGAGSVVGYGVSREAS